MGKEKSGPASLWGIYDPRRGTNWSHFGCHLSKGIPEEPPSCRGQPAWSWHEARATGFERKGQTNISPDSAPASQPRVSLLFGSTPAESPSRREVRLNGTGNRMWQCQTGPGPKGLAWSATWLWTTNHQAIAVFLTRAPPLMATELSVWIPQLEGKA